MEHGVDGEELRTEIKKMLDRVSSQPAQRVDCPRCGKLMKAQDAVFFLYGTELSWHVQFPMCDCEPNKSVAAPAAGLIAGRSS